MTTVNITSGFLQGNFPAGAVGPQGPMGPVGPQGPIGLMGPAGGGGTGSSGFLNVKAFGAKGDGKADDTAAIQAAFNAAFGPYASPHAQAATLNIPVYVPAGSYSLSSPGSAVITNVISGTGGVCRLTLSAITGTFLENDPVMVSGVNGAFFANGLWAIHIIDPTHIELIGSSFNATFTASPNAVMKLPCLKIRSVESGKIYGDGRLASAIGTASTNCALISTNGCARSSFADLGFFQAIGGVAFDLSWMTNDPLGNAGVSLQSNMFERCYFAAPYTANGPGGLYGLAIGGMQNMGSETTILDCFISGCDTGLVTLNGNALQQTVIGGNISQCNTGIATPTGSCPAIIGVGFQQNRVADINVGYDAGDAYSISSCRSENSAGFLITGPTLPVVAHGCSYLGSGFFHTGHALLTVMGCSSGGTFDDGGTIAILNSKFTNPAFLTTGTQRYVNLFVVPQIQTTQTGTTYSIVGADCGSRISFNRATVQTVTLPRTHGNGTFLVEGAKIEVQQIGAGQVTFVGTGGVTMRSSAGLKLRAQWSCATLTCIGPDFWLLSGDTAV